MSRRTISVPVDIGKGMRRITVTSKMIVRKLAVVEGVIVDENRAIFPIAIEKIVNSVIAKARKERRVKKMEEDET